MERSRSLAVVGDQPSPTATEPSALPAASRGEATSGQQVAASDPGHPAERRGGPPPGSGEPSTGSASHPSALGIVFDITKAEVDLQFKIAERFDAKARGFIAAAAAFFAAAQAIALRSDVLNALSKSEKDAVLWVAVGAAALVVLGLVAMWNATRPAADWEYNPDRLRARLQEVDEPYAAHTMVNSYISNLQVRQEANQVRRCRLTWVQVVGVLVVAVCAAELIIALRFFA